MPQGAAQRVFLIRQCNVEAVGSQTEVNGPVIRLPPGLPPPPGLSLPPSRLSLAPSPDPVVEKEVAAICAWVQATSCCRGDTDSSTADTSEASLSLPSSPQVTRPATPDLRSAPLLEDLPSDASCRIKKTQDAVYIPGRLLLQAAKPAALLRLAEALPSSAPEGPVRVPAVPSVGSVGHHLGLCKPCDFTYRSGSCREGAACRFCHLCGPEVSRRRKKQRKQVISAIKQCQSAAGRTAWDP